MKHSIKHWGFTNWANSTVWTPPEWVEIRTTDRAFTEYGIAVCRWIELGKEIGR